MGFGLVFIICKFCFIYIDLRTLPYESMNPGLLSAGNPDANSVGWTVLPKATAF